MWEIERRPGAEVGPEAEGIVIWLLLHALERQPDGTLDHRDVSFRVGPAGVLKDWAGRLVDVQWNSEPLLGWGANDGPAAEIDGQFLIGADALQAGMRTARYRELRAALGLPIPTLAEALGRSPGTVSRYGHAGRTALIPPQAVVDRMQEMLLERSRQDARAQGYDVIPLRAA